IADHDHVEPAVLVARLRRHPHAAAEELPVGNDYREGLLRVRVAVVAGDVQPLALVAKERLEGTDREPEAALVLPGRLEILDEPARQPAGRDVDEVAAERFAFVAQEVDA